ncbi:amidohydrolase [Anaerosalibacter massiliensis]|uniref:Amidohydrolase n=1 Tax=Anaerosalibacter massiliensis TaxID=1347392 RepID=A0A9X2MJ43_9FIRM|nr:amidohydrolase [Anaerosalibacter massiliensis]MCR2044468.1 amidohydrolase [Anaerosalibacter massiliensis]
MDKIILNGKIATMVSKYISWAEAIAIKDKKIAKVGTNEEVLDLKSDNTEIIDLKGKTVLPGFNDSHMHLLSYGYSCRAVNLNGTESIDGIVERIKDFIKDKNIKKGKWIVGRGWNDDYFKDEKTFPTRYDLDRVSTEHPIAIIRACGHIQIANSKALELAGITKDTPQIEGGKFDLDENREPTGIFREKAIELLTSQIPEPTVEDIKEMLLEGIEDANSCGITSIQTDDFEAIPGNNFHNILKAYRELEEEGKLSLRIYEQCLLPSMDRINSFLNSGYRTGWGNEYFRIGPLKLLGDGSLGARTAALTQPYADCPDTRGIPVFTQEEIDELVEVAHNNDMQVAVHCIGDKAMYMTFEAIEKALNKSPREDHRHGIVHCQITDEYLLNKFKELNAVAYIQPIFLDYDWKIVKDRVGEKLEKTSYNWKTLLDSGVHIACGSDAPVESFNVLNGIYEAVTRKDLKGNPEGGWMPEQKLTVEEAVYGFTKAGAYTSFEEDIKGSIEEGKLADIVVLSKNIFEIPEDEIKNIEVEMTIFDGEIVYEK